MLNLSGCPSPGSESRGGTGRLTLNRSINPKEQNMIRNFFRDETGLELSEYAVAAALVAIAAVIAFTTLGNAISSKINTLAATISG